MRGIDALFGRLLAGIVLLMAGIAGAQEYPAAEQAYDENIRVRVIGSQENVITLEVLNENEAPPTEKQRRISVFRWLAVPPGTSASYTMTELEWYVTWPDGEFEGPLAIGEMASAGEVPTSVERVGGARIGDFRSMGLVQMQIGVTSAMQDREKARRQGTAYLKRAVIEATLSGARLGEEAKGELAETDPYLVDFLNDIVVNPEHLERFHRELKPIEDLEELREWNALRREASEKGKIFLAKITHPGIYRLTPGEFTRMGINPLEIDGTRLRLFAGKHELPVYRHEVEPGPFSGIAAVSFYVPDVFPPETPYIPLWLIQSPDGEGSPDMEMLEEATTPLQNDPETDITSTEFVFEPDIFFLGFPYGQRTGYWATAECLMGGFARTPFFLEGVDPDKAGSVKVAFTGYSRSRVRSVIVYVNGEQVSEEESFGGVGPHQRTLAIPEGVLREGENEIVIHYPEIAQERRDNKLVMVWAEVTYPVDRENFPINRAVDVSGPKDSNVRIQVARKDTAYRIPRTLLDISDPLEPRIVPTITSRAIAGVQAFQASVKIGDKPVQLYYTDEDCSRYVGKLKPYEHTELLDPREGADYLIVTHPDLRFGVAEHAERRRQQGKRTKIVDVDDIYATFDYGVKGYRPIADFFEHVLSGWPSPRMSQVLLVGESSEYWWEEKRPRPHVTRNLLPVFGYGNPGVNIRGDDGYSLVYGGASIPDFEIGRLSSADGHEILAMTERIWDYEQNPSPGPWLKRHAFITDDEPEFAKVAEHLISTQLSEDAIPERVYLQNQPYEDYFRIIHRKRSDETTERIVDALSDGALTATYLGHGGPNLWSSERIFHYRDIDRLDSGIRRPIMTAASCDTAWLDYPVDPVRQSIAEQFMTAPNGGAMAVFAPLSGTNSYEHDYLLRPFFEALHRKRFEELGKVALYSKIQYLLKRNREYVSNQYVLLGDPALRIPRPTGDLGLEIRPPELFSNQGSAIHIEGLAPNISWGVAQARLIDAEGFTAAGPVRVPLQDKKFRIELPTPRFLAPGSYRISIQAYNRGEGQHEAVEARIPVLDPNVQLDWAMDPKPDETAIVAGMPVTLGLRAQNLSAGFMNDLVLTIRDVGSGTDLTSSPLTLEPGTPRYWPFQFPAPAGINLFEAVVRYKDAPPHHPPVAEALLEFEAASDDLPSFATAVNLMKAERRAAPQQTAFEIPVFNLRDKVVRNLRGELFLLDSEEGTSVGSRLIGEPIKSGERVTLDFVAGSRFPVGKLPFRLDVTAADLETGQPIEQSLTFTLNIPEGTDLIVVPGSVRTERDSYVQGQTVFVSGVVRNRGKQPVESLQTTLYVDLPWDEDSIAESWTDGASIVFDDPLLPGEEREVRLRWDPSGDSNLSARLYVVTNASRRISESNFSNNVGDVAVSLLRLPNISIDRSGLSLVPDYVRPGEVVSLTVPYRNASPFDFAHPFVVHMEVHGPEQDPVVVYRETLERLDAGEEGVIQTAWRTDGLRDNVQVILNEDRDYGEVEMEDNIAAMTVKYLISEQFLHTDDPNVWSFKPTFEYGKRSSVYVSADRSLVVSELPKGGTRLPFRNEYVVGPELPEDLLGAETDNLMNLYDDSLNWSHTEKPEPVQFRIPLPAEDGTTLYDLYVHQLGQVNQSRIQRNRYQYRLEEDEDWTEMADYKDVRVYLGRIETRDDWLDVGFAPLAIPSQNSIFSIEAVPVLGDYVSPVYEIDGMPEAVLEIDARTPTETKVRMQMRVGYGSANEPEFTDWRVAKPGDRLPGDPEAVVLQWKATLLGDRHNMPVLMDVRLRSAKPEEVAEARP